MDRRNLLQTLTAPGSHSIDNLGWVDRGVTAMRIWSSFAAVAALSAVCVAQSSNTISDRERDYRATNGASVPLVEARELRIRGGLPNVFAKLQRGGAVKIGYFGGSITAAQGWRPLTFAWFQKQFPKAQIEMLHASVGGTGSEVGAFRADYDLVRHKPDLVFVEFAVNDAGDARRAPNEVKEALEGIVRKLWKSQPLTDIVFVYTLQGPDVNLINAGKFQNAASVHEQVAEHYDIPSIHLGMEVSAMVRDGKAVFTAPPTPTGRTDSGAVVFTNDGTHPTSLGYDLYASAAIRGLAELSQRSGEVRHLLRPPLMVHNWEDARTVPVDGNAKFEGEWEKLTAADGPACFRFGKRFYEWFPYLYRTREAGASVTIRFRGTRIGVKGMTGPDSGCVAIRVDGEAPRDVCQFDVYSRMYAYQGTPLAALPEGIHTVTWTFSNKKPDKGKILASYSRPGNDQDFKEHPERYADHNFSAGQIIVIGEVLPAVQATYYVSPSGSDTNPGDAARPFQTLERARDAARVHRPAVIVLRGGFYPRSRPLELNSSDNETVWRAMPGEAARLSSAIPIPRDFIREIGAQDILARLDPAARGHVVEIDTKALGIAHNRRFPDNFSDGGDLFDLFYAGARLPVARWPNRGYAHMVRVTDNGDWSNGPNRRGGAFVYAGDRPARWTRALATSGVWLDGYWRVPWAPEKVRVASIDLEHQEIRQAVPVNLGIGSKYSRPQGDGKEPWYALNLLEEIDQPGEWALDFLSGKLYVWPPGAGELSIADRAGPLLVIRDASDIRIENLTLEGGLGNGVEISGGGHNVIAGCTFQALGRTGVILNGGAGHRVESSDFVHLGHGGVSVSGGDRRTLQPAGHTVVNNYFHHLGEVKKTYAPAIDISFGAATPAVGMVIANNLIHDLPHAAVLYAGNDHLMERNEVHNVALDSGDVGAFYTTNDWTSRGNVLRHNFVHHASGANAFYLDDGDCGDQILGNVIYRTGYGPFIGGGHDNIVRGNLIVEAKRGVHLDARGVARHYDQTDKHKMALLNSVDYRNAPWSIRYPELQRILEHPERPEGNIIEDNALVGCPEPTHFDRGIEEWSTIRNNAVLSTAEAGLVDTSGLDFRLRLDSPLKKRIPQLGEIPFEQIGLYLDGYRRRLPTDAETGRKSDHRAERDLFDSDTDRRATDKK